VGKYIKTSRILLILDGIQKSEISDETGGCLIMPEQQPQDNITPLLSDFNTKLRDLEEKQRLLKERVLLIGNNLVEMREDIGQEISELRVISEQSKSDILKIRETLQRVLDELETRARRQELELLKKQAKMFQPLELATKEDVQRMIKER